MRNRSVEFCPSARCRPTRNWANRSAYGAAQGASENGLRSGSGSIRKAARAHPYEVPSRAPGRPKIAKESHAGSPSLRIDSRASAMATASGRPELKAR